jgi:tetratricopeptide (TPR) repeat protein
MPPPVETKVERLRRQAERAIDARKSRTVVLPLLERLVAAAPRGSEAGRYGHRQLVEQLVDHHPWRALLHARALLADGGRPAAIDDELHGLVGLAHALLGNYAAAVAAYRRAVAIAPSNPWHQHNLGHLLDVGLGEPRAARRHLEAAHRGAGPDDGEISGSLAHCLARLGELEAARAHAEVACQACPTSAEHAALLAWIEAGAPVEGPSSDEPAPSDGASDAEPVAEARREDPVAALLRAGIARDERLQERALALWADYAATKEPVFLDATPAPVWAAMVDFACRERAPSETSAGAPIAGRARRAGSLASSARRYRVKTEALRARWIALLEEWASAGGRWASLLREVEGPAQQRAGD